MVHTTVTFLPGSLLASRRLVKDWLLVLQRGYNKESKFVKKKKHTELYSITNHKPFKSIHPLYGHILLGPKDTKAVFIVEILGTCCH